jgi:hypothetical protein
MQPSQDTPTSKAIEMILHYAWEKRSSGLWQDKDDFYWLARLMQEVGELGSSLVGDHKDTPEHELLQIATISLNWLARRYEQAASEGVTFGA